MRIKYQYRDFSVLCLWLSLTKFKEGFRVEPVGDFFAVVKVLQTVIFNALDTGARENVMELAESQSFFGFLQFGQIKVKVRSNICIAHDLFCHGQFVFQTAVSLLNAHHGGIAAYHTRRKESSNNI